MTSYLPGLLYDYLEAPVYAHREDRYIYELRDLVSAGYYRATIYATMGNNVTCRNKKQCQAIADLFCSLSPFNYKVAYHVSYSLYIQPQPLETILQQCMFCFNVAAFRFLIGPFRKGLGVVSYAIRKMDFYPGYAELLLLDPTLLIECALIEYATPKAYKRVYEIKRVEHVHDEQAYHAVRAGNYRLARYIKANYFGYYAETCIDMLSRSTPSPRLKAMLDWVLENGWIDAGSVATIQAAWARWSGKMVM